ncbi:unnamed protein product [Vicia faba]|uniref:No apical meristem-associated C-terminal domain-containing protein n=1 Tax=Vicia faba TaxID=3906 RepID=A0AAV0YYW9_VICFA|nr:unnamed protein product [Vicia faba]
MPHGTQICSSGVQSNDQECETPQSCTQGSLETTKLSEEVAPAPSVNTHKQRFQQREDEVLIQTWLNVSKDSIVGVDKKGYSFWKRIDEAYNKHRDINYKERKLTQLKGRWHKINPSVQKFIGCYKQVMSTQQSGSSESNIMQAAYKIYFQDESEKFTFEAAWRLLKDEPKWLAGRPIGQKAAKRNEKEKLVEMSSTPNVKYDSLKDDLKMKIDLMSMFAQDYARIEGEKLEIERKKVDAKIKKAEIVEERLRMNDLQILSKDTSNMDARQLQVHEILCDMIREKYGIN